MKVSITFPDGVKEFALRFQSNKNLIAARKALQSEGEESEKWNAVMRAVVADGEDVDWNDALVPDCQDAIKVFFTTTGQA